MSRPLAAGSATEVKESVSGKYSAILRDEAGNPVPDTSLDTLTITLYDEDTGTIINTRDHQDALNQNQVTLDINGNLAWLWLPEDMPIIDDTKAIERHVVLFEAKWSSGVRRVNHEVLINVRNIDQLS